MPTLVLLRHGESTWNQENRFTGWTDVDLTEKGRLEAAEAGRLLRAESLGFDIAYTSVLKRAIRTCWLVLDELDLLWIPVERSWRLNERHYGALQGLNKAETAAKHGEPQTKIWRRSYDIPPPPLDRHSHAPLRRERRELLNRFDPQPARPLAPVRRGLQRAPLRRGLTIGLTPGAVRFLRNDEAHRRHFPTDRWLTAG